MAKDLPELDASNFQQEVLQADVPVVVEFGATWCGPCRALEPILGKLAQKYGTTRKVVTVNIDDSPTLASDFAVRGVPTIVVFAKGKEVARQVGLANEAKIAALVDAAV